ncbi:lipopolysaccharide biosynthesis protein [Sphingosinicella soli]|uniref:O-antigen/teichoic acid export membrane protein n=1 Tax=Sphingosinicella soli TaxID=333708 RepID=A0A7W7F9C5_9SPHN|nr:oligosaccharide flippase family protein [Sphingosinicella soli]MBB4632513.1 O-antigen/teichoic acid export membrane protein [Sphingosinicella soli]
MTRPDDSGKTGISKKTVVRSAGVVAMARLGALIEAVAQPAYVWMFGLATYGIYMALWAAVNIVSNVADLAMTSAMQRTIPQAKTEERAHSALKTALVIGMVPSIIIALGVSTFAAPVAALFNAAPRDAASLELAVALFAWALPLWTFVELATSASRARKAFGPEVRLRIFWEQIVRLLMAGAAWLAGWMTMGLVVAHLASLAITAALGWRLLARYYNVPMLIRAPFDRDVLRDLLGTGLGILPANIAVRAFSDMPPLLLNMLLPGAAGASASGLFGIARKIASIPLIVRHSLYYVIQPLAAEQAIHDKHRINPVYGFASRLSMILLLPMSLLLALLAGPMLMLFPPEAATAAALIVVLTLARGVNAIAGPANGILQMLRPRILPTANALVGVAVWLLVSWLLWGRDPALAMAWGVACGAFVMEWLALAELWHTDRIHPFAAPFARGIVILGGSSLLIWALLGSHQPFPLWLDIALPVVAALSLVWLGLRVVLTAQERQSLGAIGRRLGLSRGK